MGAMETVDPGLLGHLGMQPTPTPTATPSPPPNPTSTPQPAPLSLPEGDDWSQYRFDVAGTGANPESQLDSSDVGSLAIRWHVGSDAAFESTPAIVNGIVYVTNGNSLYAYTLQHGALLWRFDAIPQQVATVSSSVAVDPTLHLAFYGNPDARLYAVDIRTGKGLWSALLSDQPGAFIWSSPLVINGKVYVGIASHNDDPCVRGAIYALDEQTGVLDWTHYTVPQGALGGTVWSSLTANPALHELIATTGNPCLDYTPIAEEDSIVGLDWDTGATRWQYQALAYDDCDCDFGEGAVDVVYQGREYIVAGNKYGMVYALARAPSGGTPGFVWQQRIATWGFVGQGGIFEPPTYGDGLVFVAGGPPVDGGECPSGGLYAFHIESGDEAWHTCTAGQVVSPGALTGGVLFVAQQDALVAYDAATGQALQTLSQSGAHWGGVAIAHGYVVNGSVPGMLYCYSVHESIR